MGDNVLPVIRTWKRSPEESLTPPRRRVVSRLQGDVVVGYTRKVLDRLDRMNIEKILSILGNPTRKRQNFHKFLVPSDLSADDVSRHKESILRIFERGMLPPEAIYIIKNLP